MENIGHETLEAHIADATDILGALKILRRAILTTLTRIVDHLFGMISRAESLKT